MRAAYRGLHVAFFLAARSIARGNAGVTVMSIAMMMVVFISVSFLPSLIAGAVTEINGQVVDTLTGDLTITSSTKTTIGDAGAYLREITGVEGVVAATGIRRVGNQIAHKGESNAWGVDAVDPGSFGEVFTTPRNLIEGDFLTAADTEGIVLGVDIAGADMTGRRAYSTSLKSVHAGDVVDVTMAGGVVHSFTVRGIYRNNFPLSDQGAYITTAAADALVSTTDHTASIPTQDTVTRIVVKGTTSVSSAELEASLEPLRDDVQFQTPDQLAAAIQDQVETFDLINQIMRVISLLVAAITVFIVTYVDLTNRRRQIGIERAVGIRSNAIVGSYVLKSIFTAAIGTVLGNLAFTFALVPLVDRYPFIFPTGPVRLVTETAMTVQTVVILLIVAAVSALVPAIRTVSMKILDAIWGN
ncbi:ABC transporter permease [soil metagenome]